jgi:hypothetical protein
MKETSRLNRLIESRHKPKRDIRIHIIADNLVSKRNLLKAKGKRRISQMIIDDENFVQERVTSLESILEKEASIYDDLRGRRSKISALRRRMMYWRLFRSYGLTIQMIASFLDVSQSTARKRVGEAYVHIKRSNQRPEPNLSRLC